MATKPHKGASNVPSREAVQAFIQDSPTPVGRREIARAFGVRGSDRAVLRALLKDMTDDGLIDLGRKRTVAAPGALPAVTLIEVTGIDADGEVVGAHAREARGDAACEARAEHWHERRPSHDDATDEI